MIVVKDKEKARQLRHELAAELSKKKPDVENIRRIRSEIYKYGGRVGANPDEGFHFVEQKWGSRKNASVK